MNTFFSREFLRTLAGAFLALLVTSTCFAERIISDGSDGAFSPAADQTIVLGAEAPDGIFNFTTIHIPAGITITFLRNDLNTPVFFAATGEVLIEGTIDVSGQDFSRTGGPGGWDGGLASPNHAGTDGLGPSPGQGGPAPVDQGNAGGGGGMATDGLTATSRTGSNPAPGGPAIERPELASGQTGGGGSGGGGGGGRLFYGVVDIPGGDGGGGGGGLQISTPSSITVSGSLIANGAHGVWAFENELGAHGGPGGGGAGGNMELYANAITVTADATLEARGGAGGGLSTETVPYDPFFYSSGAHGGQGYLLLSASSFAIDPAATINAAVQQNVVPEPGTLAVLAAAGLFLLGGARRRRRCR